MREIGPALAPWFFKAPDSPLPFQLCGSRSATTVSFTAGFFRNRVDLLLGFRSSCNYAPGDLGADRISRRELGLDDLIAHRVSNQFAYGMNFQLAHDVGAVSLRCFHADAENGSDFFAGLALGEQLHDLALA